MNCMRTCSNSISGSLSLITYQHNFSLLNQNHQFYVYANAASSFWLQVGGEFNQEKERNQNFSAHCIMKNFKPGNRLKACHLNFYFTTFQDYPAKCFIKHASCGDSSTAPCRTPGLPPVPKSLQVAQQCWVQTFGQKARAAWYPASQDD